MTWSIKYTESAQRHLRKLDRQVAIRVLDFMDERVAGLDDPRAIGKNLTGPKIGAYWRYRVGDVRIICDIRDHELLILVIEIGHRREVYRN